MTFPLLSTNLINYYLDQNIEKISTIEKLEKGSKIPKVQELKVIERVQSKTNQLINLNLSILAVETGVSL